MWPNLTNPLRIHSPLQNIGTKALCYCIILYHHTWGALPKRSSGVDEHINTRSTSSGSTCAIWRAFLAASTAKAVTLSLPITLKMKQSFIVSTIRMSLYKETTFHVITTMPSIWIPTNKYTYYLLSTRKTGLDIKLSSTNIRKPSWIQLGPNRIIFWNLKYEADKFWMIYLSNLLGK